MIKVFVSGCYDILHGGHIEFFTQAKALGDYLIVSFAGDKSLEMHKNKKSSLPVEHKKRIIESLSMVDEVVVGDNLDELGLDFKEHFLRIKPDILAVTEDDKYEDKKRKLCNLIGAKYIKIPKTLNFEKISTTEIINYIKAPKEVPLRIDFAGGWLDVPKFAREGAYIVDCTISPKVSLKNWPYKIGSGLGGSAAYAILTGKDSIKSELALGVGWQDPAVIIEEGLCVWKSGEKPELDFKINPNFLNNKLALLWTGKDHTSYNLVDMKRDYDKIEGAGKLAREAVNPFNIDYKKLCQAVNFSYEIQLEEGMDPLPHYGELAKKYCGGGHGGYALYMCESEKEGYDFLNKKDAVKINF